MSRHPRNDTTPELALRRALHAGGMRFRVQLPVPGIPRRTIDLAFPRQKVAVFVDGCFWHGCQQHRSVPASNSNWWAEKLRMIRERDVQTAEWLRSCSWVVLRVWEHETIDDAVARIQDAVARR